MTKIIALTKTQEAKKSTFIKDLVEKLQPSFKAYEVAKKAENYETIDFCINFIQEVKEAVEVAKLSESTQENHSVITFGNRVLFKMTTILSTRRDTLDLLRNTVLTDDEMDTLAEALIYDTDWMLQILAENGVDFTQSKPKRAPKLKVKLSVEEVAHYAEEFDMFESTVRNISKPTLTTQYNEIKATLAYSKDYAVKLYKLYKAQGGKRVIPALEEVVVDEGWKPFDPQTQEEVSEEAIEEFKPTRAERKQAIQLKELLYTERKKSENSFFSDYKAKPVKAKTKDIALLIRCTENGDYKPMFTTDLYINHGGEYCRFLELVRK